MNKTARIYILLLILFFVGIVAIEFSQPTPVDWRPSYNEKHTKPFGLKILREQLENLDGIDSVVTIRRTAYEYLNESFDWEEGTFDAKGTFLSINKGGYVDKYSTNELLKFVENGNTLFISNTYPPTHLLDTLALDVKTDFQPSKKGNISLANKRFKNDSITINRGLNQSYFTTLDTATTTVLGYHKLTAHDTTRVNFVKVDFKNKGAIYLHLQPATFTNYHLLKDYNKKYTEAVLSYIPDGAVYFASVNRVGDELGDNELRFIMNQPPLRWAWQFGLAALLVFIIFNAKRRQRIVKVIKPLENTTIAFTKTIGNLYYESKNHNNLVEKKITYFLESIRRTYYIDTQVMDEKFVKNLALKSGKDKEQIERLFKLIAQLKGKKYCSEDDLLRINKNIEKFYSN